MQTLIDITGNRYGRLTVVGFSHIGERRRSYWKCRCDCGKIVTLRKDSFVYPYSKVKSCGCLKTEENRLRPKDLQTGRYVEIQKRNRA